MKQHAPATLRNRAPIAAVLACELPPAGRVLEIASGTGEHAVYFAQTFPALHWQPSDPAAEALASIAAYRADYAGCNLAEPVLLDAAEPAGWPVMAADAIVCINLVHISPWSATEGLFAGAAQLLGRINGPVIFYGPYLEQGVQTAPSNRDFDDSLRARDSRWGLRHAEDLDKLAEQHGMACSARHQLPANNIMLVYRAGR